ncbi:SH2/SH3 adapter protein NCK1-like isoform X2 [Clavelina lepadiformis]|uniref:SH2/SH3 adapter protein NCK1-like isoform X2 n=1 Tax=Clavelina lepadiformis TaxID=159417 RepID=UPI004040F9B4
MIDNIQFMKMNKQLRKSMKTIANKFPGKKVKSGTGGGVVVGAAGNRLDVPTSPSYGASSGTSQTNEEYVSKFNYDATRDDELTLTKGMSVLVMEKEGDGWWYGRSSDQPDGKPGWFPSNYVEKPTACNVNSVIPIEKTPRWTSDGDCIMVVRTLYAFDSGNPEELAFEQDELLDIIEQPSDDPEWWLARNRERKSGLVPKNYVQVEENFPPVSTQQNYDPVFTVDTQNGLNNLNAQMPATESNTKVIEKDWYFGTLKRAEAEKVLGDRAKNGEFLVRDSETSAGDYSISMKMPGRMRHFKVTLRPDGLYGIGQRQFESMEALLDHYKQAPIYTSAEQGKVYLTNPMAR